MKDSQLLSEETYFPIANIRGDFDYYGISLYSSDGISTYYDVHCSLWVGFEEISGKKAELRRAGILKAEKYANHWKKTGEPFLVVNTIDDHINWFFNVGGHALVECSIAKDIMPWALEPSPSFVVGAIGYTDISRIRKDAFRRAPTPKLRMKIVERDLYRCRICGRRPADYVDVELHVHHIRPFGEHGLTAEENLITLCHTCHAGLDPHFRQELYELVPPSEDRPSFPPTSGEYMTKAGLYQKAIHHEAT